jgi:hypothetical protein
LWRSYFLPKSFSTYFSILNILGAQKNRGPSVAAYLVYALRRHCLLFVIFWQEIVDEIGYGGSEVTTKIVLMK